MKQPEGVPSTDLATLYRRHIVMVRNRACRLLGDTVVAQQVAQDAFLKLLEHRERQGDAHDVAAFLYRTVTNLALNRLREGLRQKELSRLRAERDNAPSAAEDSLREILALVSYDEAQVAAYYYVDGMETGEIAVLLGIERRTVNQRLSCFQERARRLVRVTGVRHVA